MKKSKKIATGIAVFSVCTVLLCTFILYGNKNKAVYSAPPPPVKIIQPQKKTIERTLIFSAYTEAASVVPVIPLVSGRITDYPAKTGMQVKEGDILAVIDTQEFKQKVIQAKAAYENAENAYNRIAALYESNKAVLQDFETSQARRDSTKASYELALLQLNHAQVRSPVSGTVLQAPLSKGSTANPAQPAAVIADLSSPVVRVFIPEKYLGLFTDKEKPISAYVEKPENGEHAKEIRAKAVPDTISPYIHPDTKTFEIVFKLTEHTDLFKPGMFIRIHIVYAAYRDVPALPLEVLKNDGSCYTYDSDNKNVRMQKFPVEVKDTRYFMVPEELSKQWFILSGSYRVFDGQKVKVIEKNGLKPTENL